MTLRELKIMKPSIDINANVLEALRLRITKVLPDQIRSCLAQLNDEQVWWRPNEKSNSVGNLVLHIRGSVMYFLCRGVGGHHFVRDRPTEFSTMQLPKEQLIELFDDLVIRTEATFTALEPPQLAEPSTEPAYYSTIFEDLFGVAIHMAVHTGQIVYITKAIQEGSIDDLWTRTHKSSGAWRT